MENRPTSRRKFVSGSGSSPFGGQRPTGGGFNGGSFSGGSFGGGRSGGRGMGGGLLKIIIVIVMLLADDKAHAPVDGGHTVCARKRAAAA